MKIFGSYDQIRPDRPTSPVAPTNNQGQAATTPVAPVPKADSVQLSESGKSMARKLDVEQRETLDPERTAELRRKVLEGAYNTLDVVDQVARRIMQRGDL
jgi:anti-sigma28 factor (negative regulator of flagellin synthesis)